MALVSSSYSPVLNGRRLDATFEVSMRDAFVLLYRHKAGGSHPVNSEYHLGLETLLTRLATVGAVIISISVESRVTQKLSPSARVLALDFPINLPRDSDIREIRLGITRAARSIGRREGTMPGGGNDQRTLEISFRCPKVGLGIQNVRDLLVFGAVSD